MKLTFSAKVFEWRGPAPFYFVRVPDKQALEIKEISKELSYGWGVVPCHVTIGKTREYTSLFPKDGGYLVPLKQNLRKPNGIEVGQVVKLELEFAL
ncbi:MAG: hypothetical protein RIQ88_228 [Actinomycetota bacterium]